MAKSCKGGGKGMGMKGSPRGEKARPAKAGAKNAGKGRGKSRSMPMSGY